MQICCAEVTAQGTGGRLTIAKENRVNHETTVNSCGNGPTDCRINKRTFLGVEFDQRHRVDHGITIGCHANVIALLEADSIDIGNGVIGCIEHFTVFHRGCTCGRIRNKPADDTVEVGQAFLPIILIFIEADILALLPFNEFERSGTNRVVGQRRRFDILTFEQVLRYDRRFIR